MEELVQLGHDLVQVEDLRAEYLSTAERQELAGQRRCPVRAGDHLLDLLGRVLAAAERAQGELAVPAHAEQKVVEVVRDPPGEPSDCLELLGLPELVLELPRVKHHTSGATVQRVIVVPGKLANVVVR